MMNRFKPLFVSSLLGEKMMECTTQKGMEEQIMKESKQYDKVIMGLETVQFQAGLFDSIPYAKQAKDLIQYIDSADNYKSNMKVMVDVYKKQDLDRMDSLTRKSDPGMDQYMDLLLYDRNRKWVQQMPSLMMEGTFVVCCRGRTFARRKRGHSPVKSKGYTVKPLKN
ncbi:MAG: TraB/GumN family protein [Chitinophagaceae bacterium]|nr:TraB/GumN family protein [Chitinophagaceae bacterium]